MRQYTISHCTVIRTCDCVQLFQTIVLTMFKLSCRHTPNCLPMYAPTYRRLLQYILIYARVITFSNVVMLYTERCQMI